MFPCHALNNDGVFPLLTEQQTLLFASGQCLHSCYARHSCSKLLPFEIASPAVLDQNSGEGFPLAVLVFRQDIFNKPNQVEAFALLFL
mmetsp:Transcript_32379/g.48269  ORF Transcript_32379/g.48269 Transcript_32379/m.48269 type:complete len:88 (+) Transcript_32379:619-882(+)